MYLSHASTANIFVTELQTRRTLRRILFVIVIILLKIPMIQGQQVWPGDINNNGIVNNIDVLYWAVAKEATGDGRLSPSTNWTGQDLPANLWDKNFPDGLNYAFADCDGDGDVDDDDKDIIEENFGLVHGEVTADEYATGDTESDPILSLSTENPVIEPGGTLEVDLSLGMETDSITDFYGIAFTVVYDPEVVSNRGNAFRLNILDDTWMSGQGDDKVIQFVNNDRNLGVAQVAIVRKNGVSVSGFGPVGTFSIVMQDIVLFSSTVSNTDIRMVNFSLLDSPVAPSELAFTTDPTTTTVQAIRQKGFKVYPNPVSGQHINIEMENPEEVIKQILMYDANGRLLSNQKLGGLQSKEEFDIGNYPNGIYTFKILTDKHLYVRSFFKQP